jgi:VRR-NUC domain
MTRRRNHPEDEIQRAVFEHLAVRGASDVFAFHPANGGWRSRIEAAIFKGLGVRPGVPDVIAIKAGRAFALELKAPGSRVTEAQRAAHVALRAAGAAVAVVHGLDAAIDQLERWKLVRGSSRWAHLENVHSITKEQPNENL